MRRLFVLLLVMSTACLAAPSLGNATDITVDQTADAAYTPAGTGGCSLRDAFLAADLDFAFGTCPAGSGNDRILVPTGNYALSVGVAGDADAGSGDLDFTGPSTVEIEPASEDARVVIDGAGLDRIFDRVAPGIGDLIIRNMTLTGGNTGPGFGLDGGAVRNLQGLFRAEGVNFFGNTAGDNGGAIANDGSLEMVNSTIGSNRAADDGGGIWQANTGANSDLRSVTLSENRADDDSDGTGDAGGIWAGTATSNFNLLNSILAGNVDASPAPGDQRPDCVSGPFFFPRYVISTQTLGAGSCLVAFAGEGNQSPVDPQLQGFGENGGPTPTYSILPSSPAVDAGGSAFPDQCPPTDQRGVERPAGACDIGSFEYFEPPPTPLPGRPTPTGTIATFDGTNLHIRLKCPARFKPKCRSTAVSLTNRRGRAMTSAARVVTRSNRWKVVRLTVKPAFRARIESMTYVDRKQLVVRQKIRSKRIRTRKAPRRPAVVFHTYKVRVKT